MWRAGLLLAWALLALGSLPGLAVAANIMPFSLADVELLPGSEQKLNMDYNLRFLMMLEVDRLAYNFRVTAGLEAPGPGPYGGWEDRSVEVRGQFMGHYMTAMALAYRNTGNETLRARAAQFVGALREVQEALGDGYLAAFPREHFDRLEALKPVWAPYYVIHKIMAGLLDQHQLAGHPEALAMVQSMARYFCGRVERVIETQGQQHWEKVLENEFGGMNEVLYNLAMETGNDSYAACAHRFDKPAFYRPLVEGRDVLAGQHANTHLAQANGFSARYEATGDPEARTAVANFLGIVLGGHSFSTGGSNWYEHWYPAHTLGDAINNTDAALITEESCTQYNILKLARSLFRWTGDAALADFYERAILNDVIGIQRHPPHADPPTAPPLAPAGAGASASGLATVAPKDLPPHAHHWHSHSSHHSSVPCPHHHHHHQRSHQRHALASSLPSSFPSSHLHPGGGSSLWQQQQQQDEGLTTLGQHAQQGLLAGASEGWGVDAAGMAAAYAAAPRPDNYQVVSWPDDPGRRFRPANQEYSPGQFIYYLPLGAGNSKGDSRGWTHGWGDPFHTFWCCYGSGVESMSKLADSIFFHRMPSPASVSAEGGAPSSPLGAKEQLPELFVNQLASSRLRWRELGVRVTMEGDLYGPGTSAAVRLKLDFGKEGPEHSSAGVAGAPEFRRFMLNWRIPSWVDESRGPKLAINGKQEDACVEGVRLAAADGGGRPAFGHGARFCSLGPDWGDGDVVEAELPMRYAVEDLNDDREGMQELKAIMMGPLLMAGLTPDSRELDVDPDRIAKAISVPDSQGLVSLQLWEEGQGDQGAGADGASRLVCHEGAGESVSLAPRGEVTASRALAMDATFRLAAPLGAAGAEGAGAAVSLESMSRPGRYLTVTSQGELKLVPAAPGDGRAAAFAMRALHAEGGSGNEATVQLTPIGASAGHAADRAGAAHAASLALRLAPPAADKYPPGARVVRGTSYSYLLAPLGQIMDERYTAYFRFLPAPAPGAAGGPRAARAPDAGGAAKLGAPGEAGALVDNAAVAAAVFVD